MRAVQYLGEGRPPVLATVERPTPGPGQVLLQITAASLCHSDLHLMGLPPERLNLTLPLILGHEGAGRVVELGAGVTEVALGDDVVVYAAWGCGSCRACAQGRENYCPYAKELGITSPGIGRPGALAEFMLVEAVRHLVPTHGLDPVQAAPLADAGLTPYAAIKASLGTLTPGSTAVVIGVGGLGHVAVQLLRALSPARVVAVDVSSAARDLALELGADAALAADDATAGVISRLTSARGAALVLDFVATSDTLRLATAVAGMESDVTILGVGGGAAAVGLGHTPWGCRVGTSSLGSRSELVELLALARDDAVTVRASRHPLREIPAVYELLRAGQVPGRAVADLSLT